MKELLDKLRKVQIALNVPKGQHNNFGNYNYRSCEDILNALKPHLETQELTLVISDELENIGERYYVKATVTLSFGEERLWVSAYAREEESKKGMDGSQITGAASSYARKYALNGMFAIDDTKDADTRDNTQAAKVATPAKVEQIKETVDAELASVPQKALITSLLLQKKLVQDKDAIKGYILLELGVNPETMTKKQASQIIKQLQEAK